MFVWVSMVSCVVSFLISPVVFVFFFGLAPCLEWCVLEEVSPLLMFASLAIFKFVVPQAFGDGGEVPLEDSEASFFPSREHSDG